LLEGLHAAAAGMAAQQTRLEALAQDVSNVDTAGYKRQRVTFRELVYVAQGNAGAGVSTGAGAAVSIAGRTFGQGAIGETANPLDVALQGPGFLRVRQGDGTVAYSRGAQLRVDARGRMTTGDGTLVDPPVRVPAGTPEKDISIGTDGTVKVDGRSYGRLSIETVGTPDGMRSLGNGLFAVTAESGPARAATGTTVLQGRIEGSNVDMADVMVDMMDAQRNFTLASRAVQMQDQLLEVANGIKR
jgi:flagellar basal-body rod protein FlgG